MNKIVFLFLVIALSTSIVAKDKYLVYFKDKPHNSVNSLKKSSPQYEEVLKNLSDESIERRQKVIGNEILLDGDLPISKLYVERLENLGAEIVWELNWFNAVSCYLSYEQLEKISELDFVAKIESVKTLRFGIIENKTDNNSELYKTQTTTFNYGSSLNQMELSDVPTLHDHNIAGENVIVGIMDAGFKTDEHNAFASMEILATKDFVFGDDDVGNDNDANHGTGVLSLVGGFEEGQLVSPAYKSKFILAKTEDIFQEVRVEEDNFAAAVIWMEGLGVDIITSSLGYNEFDSGQQSYTYADMDGETAIVTRAYEAAFNRGVVTITSAGNEGNNSWRYITAPADGKNTITVGSVNSSNVLAISSSRGPTSDGRLKPEVLAQGVSTIRATQSKGGYSFDNGTSFAAPIVAGITAQLLSVFPHLTNTQVRQIIIESGDNVDTPNNDRGYGLLSAKRAVEYPNINFSSSQAEINKVFLPLLEVNTDEVFFNYRINSEEEFFSDRMQFDGRIKFTALLPTLATGDTLELWFTYQDDRGSSRRQPGDISRSYFYMHGSNHVVLNVNATAPINIPDDFFVEQNYPNPFNPITHIEFKLVKKAKVKITVYDMLGREIKVLLNEERDAGSYNDITWNATNNHGSLVSSGPYLYVFKAGKHIDAKKMIYLR